MPKPAKLPKATQLPKTAQNRSQTSKLSRAGAAVSPLVDTTRLQQARPHTKQAGVLVLLRSASGTTITAIAEQTGWQQHSVRGFLARVVRIDWSSSLRSKQDPIVTSQLTP